MNPMSLKKLVGKIKTKSRQERLEGHKDFYPHPALSNFHTIKWLRRRFNDDVIKKSIYTLLPNNGEPLPQDDEEQKSLQQQRLEKAKEYLSKNCKPQDKYKNTMINPKYFFSKLAFKKILQLKAIFLQFDEDGSRKMEIDEMETMFNKNKIAVVEEELRALFFKDKKIPQGEMPYLDFYQFMQFAMSKACDQDFRLFMRRIKQKILKKENDERRESEKVRFYDDEEENLGFDQNIKEEKKIEKEKDGLYLPMNFNLVLDYFINKGEERESKKIIRKAIKLMNKVIDPDYVPPKEEEDEDEDEEDDQAGKVEKKDEKGEAEGSDIKRTSLIDDYDMQKEDIDTEKLMEEFKKLLNTKHSTEHSQNSNRMARKMMGMDTHSITNTLIAGENRSRKVSADYTKINIPGTNTKILPSNLSNFQTKTLNTERSHCNNAEQDSQEEDHPQFIFSNMILNKLSNVDVKEMNKAHYEKFKSIQLAAEETRKKIEGRGYSPNSSKYSHFRSTAAGTGGFGVMKNNRTDIKWYRPTGKERPTSTDQLPLPRIKIPNGGNKKSSKANDHIPYNLLQELRENNHPAAVSRNPNNK